MSLSRLPPGRLELVAEAGMAIAQEHREAAAELALRCHRVRATQAHAAFTLYLLDIGFRRELDWTWEGAVAWQPARDARSVVADDFADEPDEPAAAWRGTVVAVDEVRGHVWVMVEGEREGTAVLGTPRAGELLLRPFPFLAALRRVYDDEALAWLHPQLAARLHLALGAPPPPGPSLAAAAPFDRLWPWSWSCLWGPPGTGKPAATGAEVARLVRQRGRTLVVSTTNKATDAIALAIGRTLLAQGAPLRAAVRVGRAADYAQFQSQGLLELLDGGASAARARSAELAAQLRRTTDPRQLAWLRAMLRQAQHDLDSRPAQVALDPQLAVVVVTAYAAVAMLSDPLLLDALATSGPPFTTVVIDEAGLVPRAAVAAISLLAEHRMLLVGDPRQLAPIAKICRVLPSEQARWMAESALGHLRNASAAQPGMALLTVQHRMHPDIRAVVSAYQYAGRLSDGPGVGRRAAPLSAELHKVPRALWYVLDEVLDGEATQLSAVRAERGPGNKSWVRPVSFAVLDKLFETMPELVAGPGLFLAPFVAQARAVARWFAERGITGWSASTVHAQQGVEADYVVFDTVHAGAHVWPTDEWQRLINVGLSRAREFVFVLASRHEMVEPFLAPLVALLPPRCLVDRHGAWRWRTPSLERGTESSVLPELPADASALGAQLMARQTLRPLLSREQQRLCELTMDGKPRLVRGVAGSGKTIVLAHWLAQVVGQLRDVPDARVWVVYANRSLKGLIEDHVLQAWQRGPGGSRGAGPAVEFPWQIVELQHVRDLLLRLRAAHGMNAGDFGFDYERGAAELVARAGAALQPLCDALFVDEAQDLGHSTLDLLTRVVRCSSADDARARNVIVFYDNAQNVYGRGVPTWSALGLDMRGRSTVLKEAFRSTQPISEFALNVLHRLVRADLDPDHQELLRRGLIEETRRRGRRWFKVCFNQIDGPLPSVHVFDGLHAELAAVTGRVCELIAAQRVAPRDIKLLYAGKDVAEAARTRLAPALAACGARVEVQTSETFVRDRDAVVVTTPHSFKGYDAEVVLVLAAERFIGPRGPLGHPLYVAMTRARSVLEIYGQTGGATAAGLGVLDVLAASCEDLVAAADPAPERVTADDREWLLARLGERHRAWFEELCARTVIRCEPIHDAHGTVLLMPLFTFERRGRLCAVLDPAEVLEPNLRQAIAAAGVVVVAPGAAN
jgi:hypothetical protein